MDKEKIVMRAEVVMQTNGLAKCLIFLDHSEVGPEETIRMLEDVIAAIRSKVLNRPEKQECQDRSNIN